MDKLLYENEDILGTFHQIAEKGRILSFKNNLHQEAEAIKREDELIQKMLENELKQ